MVTNDQLSSDQLKTQKSTNSSEITKPREQSVKNHVHGKRKNIQDKGFHQVLEFLGMLRSHDVEMLRFLSYCLK